MKKIESKMKALDCYQDFPLYKSIGIFSNTQGQPSKKSVVELYRNSNLSEISYPIKNVGARVLTRLYVFSSDAQGQLT